MYEKNKSMPHHSETDFEHAYAKAKRKMQMNRLNNNSEWNNSLKKIKDQYSSSKVKNEQPKEIALFSQSKSHAMENVSVWKHESMNDDVSMRVEDHTLKQPKAEDIGVLPAVESNTKEQNPQTFFFTERTKQTIRQKAKEAKETRMKIQIKLLEKQMKHKLQRKILENQRLKEKMELLKDIQEAKVAKEQEKQWEQRQKMQQLKLLHQSSIDKAKMLRKVRKLNHKRQLREIGEQISASTQNLQFSEALRSKRKSQFAEILKTRQEYLTNKRLKSKSSLVNIRSFKNSLASKK